MVALPPAFAHLGGMIEGDDRLSDSFRKGMRRVASTVNVTSICVDGQPMGITGTAVSPISMGPPSLLVCINRSASVHGSMEDVSHFRVNVLHREQETIARMFADRSQHALRFLSGWDLDCAAAPTLANAQATILCRSTESHLFATHSIFIALVEEGTACEDINPLLYLDGCYGSADI